MSGTTMSIGPTNQRRKDGSNGSGGITVLEIANLLRFLVLDHVRWGAMISDVEHKDSKKWFLYKMQQFEA